MNPNDTNLKLNRSGTAARASTTQFQGNSSRKDGSMRAVTLGGQAVNANQLFCMASAVRESLEETFGSNGHDTQLEADREMYELKDNIVNFFSRVKSTSR